MITVNFLADEKRHRLQLKVTGHSGTAPAGYDIICSAASMLAYTLAQEVRFAEDRGITTGRSTVKVAEGNANITVRLKTGFNYAEMLIVFRTIQTGFLLLSHNYSGAVLLETPLTYDQDEPEPEKEEDSLE